MVEDPKLLDELPAILILQIRHFNEASGASDGTTPGWLFQTYAPVNGLLNMWNAAPASRDRNELQQFVQNLQQHGPRVWLATASFADNDPYCLGQPLSWKLSSREKRCISRGWGNLVQTSQADLSRRDSGSFGCVDAYFRRTEEKQEVPTACQQVR